MAFKLKELEEKLEKEFSIEVEGQKLNMSVWLGVKGSDYQRAQAGDADSFATTANLICLVVRKWDLVDQNDKPIPLTPETVLELPQSLLNLIRNETLKFVGDGGLTKNS